MNMYLKIACHVLFSAVEQVYKAADKKHKMPILGNIKIVLTDNLLELTTSDLDVALCARLPLPQASSLSVGQTTVPAEKLYDILKSLLPRDKKDRKNQYVELKLEKDYLKIYSDNNVFKLNTLPAEDFPSIASVEIHQEVMVIDKDLKSVIDKTEFAIALQDYRYYLMGMLFEFKHQQLTTVATDALCLAIATTKIQSNIPDFERRLIMPKKGVKELQRLLARIIGDRDKYLKKIKKKTPDEVQLSDSLTLMLGKDSIQVLLPLYDYDEAVESNVLQATAWIQFTTKLIDGQFPDYNRVFPKNQSNVAVMNYEQLQRMLRRVLILSDEKKHSSIFNFNPDSTELMIETRNGEQDKATATMPVHYTGKPLEIAFNLNYLIQVLDVMSDKNASVDMLATENIDETMIANNLTENFDVVFRMGEEKKESMIVEKASDSYFKFVVVPILI